MKSVFKRYIGLLAFLGFFFAACEDDDAVRVPDFQTGATLRLQFTDAAYTFLDMDDRANAKLEFDLFTVNDDIDSANLYMTFIDFETNTTFDTRLFETFEQADFDSEGAIRKVDITIPEIAALYGIPESEVSGGDQVLIATEVVLEDGRRYPDNVLLPDGTLAFNSPDVANATTSSFNLGFQAFAACAVPTTFAVGTYELEQISGPDDPFFGNPTRWAPETVTVTATSLIQRRFQGTYLTFTNRTFNFLLICENIIVTPTGGGVGCSGTLTWAGASPAAGSYALGEGGDDVFEITLLDNITGDCGIPANEELVLRLTKVE
jgi:hypothetical protein